MELRYARVEDIDAVWNIINQARRRLGELGIDQWQGGYPDRAAIEGDVATNRGYVAVEDTAAQQRVLGYAMFEDAGEPAYDRIYNGAWLTESPANAPAAAPADVLVDASAAADASGQDSSGGPSYMAVHRVAVADGATGRGVARFLLGSAEQMARERGFASVRIDTHEGNAPMRGLLARCGYALCGVILIEDSAEPTRERLAFEKLV